MAMSNEDLLKELSAKPIMEVVELVKMLEDEFNDFHDRLCAQFLEQVFV